MIILACPNCGERNVQEFRFGGEYNPRPVDPMALGDRAWADYIYLRDNKAGVHREWWYHQSGCASWFLAERHTKTNRVIRTWRWSATDGSEPEAGEKSI